MLKVKDREKALCITSIIIVFACYCLQKTIEAIMVPDRHITLITATLYMLILCCIIYYLAYCEEPFYGLLTSLIGYKMMPVPILYFYEVSRNGSILYYLLIKAAQLIFVVMIIKFYNAQDKENKISAMPILTMMLSVPFFSEIGNTLTNFFVAQTGSYLLGYFSQFACYGIATFAIIGVSMLYGYKSLRFMTYYEFTALTINIIRVGGKVAFKLYNQHHVSGSLYGWLLVYFSLLIVIIIANAVIRKREMNTASR